MHSKTIIIYYFLLSHEVCQKEMRETEVREAEGKVPGVFPNSR